jgi:hypothetical protein
MHMHIITLTVCNHVLPLLSVAVQQQQAGLVHRLDRRKTNAGDARARAGSASVGYLRCSFSEVKTSSKCFSPFAVVIAYRGLLVCLDIERKSAVDSFSLTFTFALFPVQHLQAGQGVALQAGNARHCDGIPPAFWAHPWTGKEMFFRGMWNKKMNVCLVLILPPTKRCFVCRWWGIF